MAPLLKFLSDLNPQSTPARLALFNWLRGFASPDEPLTHELFERFFWDCLDYPHWTGNKTQLGHELKFLLNNFNSFYHQQFDVSRLRFPETVQVIEIEQAQDFQDALTCYLNQQMGPEDKLRLLPDGKQLVAIILREDGAVEVRMFSRKFTLRGGLLEPLRRDLALFYTPELELSSRHQHKIEIAPSITAQFNVEEGRIHGVCLRGFVFQRLAEMKGEPLREIARLAVAVKRLEQLFVDRRSDRDYVDMIQKLEKTKTLLQTGDSEGIRWATALLPQARTALERIYLGDRKLGLLVRDLRHIMQMQGDLEECQTLEPIVDSD